jgi:hypothetical protein
MPRQPPFHVRVSVTGFDAAGDAGPGILLEWRYVPASGVTGGAHWEGLVIYARTYSTGSGPAYQVTQAWTEARFIRPLD